jgi:nucleoid-associated protein YgaU
MRHLVKYFLVVSVVLAGFYAARQFQIQQSDEDTASSPGRGGPVEFNSTYDQAEPARPASTDPVPVAALVDVDKMLLPAADEAERSLVRARVAEGVVAAGGASIKRQPTVTRQSTAKRQATELGAPESSGWESSERADAPGTVADSGFPEETEPPRIADSYRPRLEPLTDGSRQNASPETTGSVPASDDSLGEADEGDLLPSRRHEIADGDTLPRLAERYLGSRDRYLDIYRINQDVLTDPRLLPIGVEIAIPEAAQ